MANVVPKEPMADQETTKERFVPYEDRIPYDGALPNKQTTPPLPDAFGRELDTLERARQWLTNPHNWHDTKMFILKWEGLLCTISKDHAARLIREWWDDGLPWAACYEQHRRKQRGTETDGVEKELDSADGSAGGSDD